MGMKCSFGHGGIGFWIYPQKVRSEGVGYIYAHERTREGSCHPQQKTGFAWQIANQTAMTVSAVVMDSAPSITHASAYRVGMVAPATEKVCLCDLSHA